MVTCQHDSNQENKNSTYGARQEPHTNIMTSRGLPWHSLP
jgi:hypothetical protein